MDKISTSVKREDYEILVRKRGKNNFVAYCPQLNRLLKSETFEQAFYEMENLIIRHIKLLADEFDVFHTILPQQYEHIISSHDGSNLNSDCIGNNDSNNSSGMIPPDNNLDTTAATTGSDITIINTNINNNMSSSEIEHADTSTTDTTNDITDINTPNLDSNLHELDQTHEQLEPIQLQQNMELEPEPDVLTDVASEEYEKKEPAKKYKRINIMRE